MLSDLASRSSQGKIKVSVECLAIFFLLMIFSIYHYSVCMYEVQEQAKVDSVLIVCVCVCLSCRKARQLQTQAMEVGPGMWELLEQCTWWSFLYSHKCFHTL